MEHSCETCNFFKGIGLNCKIGYLIRYTQYDCKDHSQKVTLKSTRNELTQQMQFYRNNYEEINNILKNETSIITLLKMIKKHRDILWKINKNKQ